MPFDIEGFLKGSVGSLALFNLTKVEVDGPGSFSLSVSFDPAEGLLGEQSEAVRERIGGADLEFDIGASWSENSCMLHLFCVMELDEFGPVDMGKALSVANYLNGLIDRVVVFSVPLNGVNAPIGIFRSTLLVPYHHLTSEEQIDTLRVIFRNALARFMLEIQQNVVDVHRALYEPPGIVQ